MTTALVFTYRWPALREGLLDPRTVENVVFVEEINATPLSFIYCEHRWYQMQAVISRTTWTNTYRPAPKELPESQVPKELRAWALILT